MKVVFSYLVWNLIIYLLRCCSISSHLLTYERHQSIDIPPSSMYFRRYTSIISIITFRRWVEKHQGWISVRHFKSGFKNRIQQINQSNLIKQNQPNFNYIKRTVKKWSFRKIIPGLQIWHWLPSQWSGQLHEKPPVDSLWQLPLFWHGFGSHGLSGKL